MQGCLLLSDLCWKVAAICTMHTKQAQAEKTSSELERLGDMKIIESVGKKKKAVHGCVNFFVGSNEQWCSDSKINKSEDLSDR